jgi:Anthrone oxygenase
MILDLVELVAVFACTLFTGAAVYITAVEHPARLSCGPDIAAAEWAPSYKRGTIMQAPLAFVAGLFGTFRSVEGGGSLWIWGAILILVVIPFTLIVIRPTNNQLIEWQHRNSDQMLHLLRSWGRLHLVRSALGVAASILFIWAASR